MKLCPICKTEKKPEEFPRNSTRPDRRNLYCKECSREKVRAYRERLKEIAAVRRKHNLVARTPVEKVRRAIKEGARSREEIRRVTRLDWDSVTSALAILRFDLSLVQIVFVNREPHFYPVAA